MAEQGEKAGEGAKTLSSLLADLPGVVREFWAAVASPLLELAVTLIALSFVLGLDMSWTSTVARLAPAEHSQVSTVVEFYGLKALIPAAVLIAILGVAQANSTIMRTIGDLVPGKLIPNTTALLFNYAQASDVLDVWRTRPDIKDINTLNSLIDADIEQPLRSDPNRALLSGTQALRAQMYRYISMGRFIKGLLIVVLAADLMSTVLQPRVVDWARVWLFVVLVALALLYVSTNRIRAERAYNKQKVRNYLSYLQIRGVEGTSYRGGNPAANEAETVRINAVYALKQVCRLGGWSIDLGIGTPAADLSDLMEAWCHPTSPPGPQEMPPALKPEAAPP